MITSGKFIKSSFSGHDARFCAKTFPKKLKEVWLLASMSKLCEGCEARDNLSGTVVGIAAVAVERG
jgi:hypothetical protein